MKTKLKPLNEQTIVLLGASSGMGRVTALEAARRGAKIVVASRDLQSLESLVDEIRSLGGEAIAVQADAAHFPEVEAIAHQAIERFGGFDTWVNFSGTSIYAPLLDTTPEEFRRVIEVNLLGEAHGAMVAMRHLRHKGGALIFISSVEGEVALPYATAYAASKHGINGMFDSLSLEIQEAQLPISATLVMPAGVNTPLFTNAKTKLGVKPRPVPPIYAPEQVAKAVLFAAENPIRELYVGGAARLFVLGKRFFPRLVEAYLLRRGFSGQKSDQPKGENDLDNLFAAPHEARAHGEFEQATRRFSFYTWLQTHPTLHRSIKAMVLLAAANWLAGRGNSGLRLSRGNRAWWCGPVCGAQRLFNRLS